MSQIPPDTNNNETPLPFPKDRSSISPPALIIPGLSSCHQRRRLSQKGDNDICNAERRRQSRRWCETPTHRYGPSDSPRAAFSREESEVLIHDLPSERHSVSTTFGSDDQVNDRDEECQWKPKFYSVQEECTKSPQLRQNNDATQNRHFFHSEHSNNSVGQVSENDGILTRLQSDKHQLTISDDENRGLGDFGQTSARTTKNSKSSGYDNLITAAFTCSTTLNVENEIYNPPVDKVCIYEDIALIPYYNGIIRTPWLPSNRTPSKTERPRSIIMYIEEIQNIPVKRSTNVSRFSFYFIL